MKVLAEGASLSPMNHEGMSFVSASIATRPNVTRVAVVREMFRLDVLLLRIYERPRFVCL